MFTKSFIATAALAAGAYAQSTTDCDPLLKSKISHSLLFLVSPITIPGVLIL